MVIPDVVADEITAVGLTNGKVVMILVGAMVMPAVPAFTPSALVVARDLGGKSPMCCPQSSDPTCFV